MKKSLPALSALLSLACLTGAATAAFAAEAGNFNIGATLLAKWNDNRDGARNHKKDGATLGAGLDFDFDKQLGPLHFIAEYEPMMRWYTHRVARETSHELTHDLYVKLENDKDQRLYFAIADHFKYIDDDNVDSRAEGADQTSLRYGKFLSYDDNAADNRLSGKLKYKLSEKFYTTLGATWRVLRYKSDRTARYSDEDSLKLSAGLWRQMSHTVDLGLSGGYGWYDEASPVYDQKMEIAKLGLSLKWYVADRASLNVAWHYQHVMYDARELSDREYPFDLDVNFRYKLGENTLGVLGYYQRIMQGENYPYVSQRRHAVFASLTHAFSDRFSTTLRGEFRYGKFSRKDVQWQRSEDDDFEGRVARLVTREGDEKTFVAHVGLNYWIMKDLKLMLTYDWKNINSEVNRSYVRNTIGARAVYNFY